MSGIKALFVLLIIILLTLSGTLLFIKGFLLSRNVVELESECLPDFALRAEDHSHHGVEGCWMHGRFKRAVIIIIDALRYDFVKFNSSLQPSDTPHYKNKLSVITQLTRRKPLHSRLYKFVADPPTTTMQRLKGLTTGSLPTFVDAGANFHSYAVTEDNLIDQMIKRDKKVKFFGDDTWLTLFPDKFYKSFEFSSFDVKNIHSVDDGILKNIYSEMKRSDWDVIIAHFLGVDHCGHTYGPNHPIMGEKLTQMDHVLRNITELLRDDTILFVMGDHGMTRTGDHGGDSADELEAGLFIYSPAQIASTPQNENVENVVAQTDFVPTVALLMGLPIPFSNLGMAIPELFGHCPWWDTTSNEIRRVYHRVKALRLNAQQINTYLSAYQKIASDLPISKLRSLQQQINRAENDVQSLITAMIKEGATDHALQKFNLLESMYKTYIRDARETCESVWAKFDVKLIAVGLLTIACGVTQGLYFLVVWSSNEESLPTLAKFFLAGSSLHLIYLAVHMSIFSESVPPLFAFTSAIVLIFLAILSIRKNVNVKNLERYLVPDNIVSSVVLAMNCCIYFSNSFVVYEGPISIFFLQTLFCVTFLKIALKNFSVQRKEIGKSDIGKHGRKSKSTFNFINEITQPSVVAFICTLICCVILRTASYFQSCREEQHSCEDSIFMSPLSSLETGTRNQRYIFSIFCLAAMVYATRSWLKHYGNMNGTSPGVQATYFGPPCAALFISLHWAVQALPHTSHQFLTQGQQALMAQIVYALIITSLVALIFSPLLVYVLPTKTDSSIQIPYQAQFRQIVPTLYNQLKLRLSEPQDRGADDKPPVVYGLGSVYSASLVLLVSVVSLLLVLLLGDAMAPSFLLATVLLYLYLELYSVSSQDYDLVSQGPSWSSMVMLSLLSTSFFFATGHQATIPSIRFESAYTGFYGDFSTFILPGFLIWLNTFAGPIFFSLACPALVFWPLLSSAVARWMLKKPSEQQKTWQGDFKMFDSAIQLRKNMFRVCCGMIVISSLKLFMTACAAALHRRHLMVWKIFAPRFVYEGAFFVTTSICVLLAFIFIQKVDHSLSKLIKNIQSKRQG